MKNLNELRTLYNLKKYEIKERLREFKNIRKNGNDKDIFKELIFCLLTPQSKAAFCWQAVLDMENKNILFKGSKKDIANSLNKVRFKNKKAEYIIEVQNKFSDEKKFKEFKNFLLDEKLETDYKREWLVKNIKGYGLKEASHFLRNIGFGDNIAILDRHILKNLKYYGLISEIPKTLTPKVYFLIENRMRNFIKSIDIGMDEFDLLLWYKETGFIFK